MGLHTADAIVLRRYPYRETSAIVMCLTDRFGKLKGIVKGLWRSPNRYRSLMEPLTLQRIVFYDTRISSLHLISQCDLLEPFEGLQRELSIAQLAAGFDELIDCLVELEEPQPAIFELFKGALAVLAQGGVPHQELRIHFILRLLRLSGFQPQLDECTGCGSRPNAQAYWSARQGGVLCVRCLHEDPKADPVDPSLLETIARLAETEAPLPIAESQTTTLTHRLDEFLRWRLDRPLKTLTFDASIRRSSFDKSR